MVQIRLGSDALSGRVVMYIFSYTIYLWPEYHICGLGSGNSAKSSINACKLSASQSNWILLLWKAFEKFFFLITGNCEVRPVLTNKIPHLSKDSLQSWIKRILQVEERRSGGGLFDWVRQSHNTPIISKPLPALVQKSQWISNTYYKSHFAWDS